MILHDAHQKKDKQAEFTSACNMLCLIDFYAGFEPATKLFVRKLLCPIELIGRCKNRHFQ